jgi:hypothetical protein
LTDQVPAAASGHDEASVAAADGLPAAEMPSREATSPAQDAGPARPDTTVGIPHELEPHAAAAIDPEATDRLDHDELGSNRSEVMNVIDSKDLERDAGGKPVSTFPRPARDHDELGSNRSEVMNVIDSKDLERDAGGKPISTFPRPALEAEIARLLGRAPTDQDSR